VAAGVAGLGSSSDFALARYNADGTLDATFGTGGNATTDFFGDVDAVHGVVIQGDGQIVAAGVVANGSLVDFALARYDADGTLDATFGTGGNATTDFFGDYDFAEAVATQADGRIVAAAGRPRWGWTDEQLTSFAQGVQVTSHAQAGVG